MPTCKRAGMEVWRSGGIEACMSTRRRAGMEVRKCAGTEACMPTCRRAGMEVWRSGDMEACIPTRRRAGMAFTKDGQHRSYLRLIILRGRRRNLSVKKSAKLAIHDASSLFCSISQSPKFRKWDKASMNLDPSYLCI